MNAIDSLFARLRAANCKAFIPFLPAGDPDLALTRELVPAVAAAGADLIEIGFPFSDPIADGPVIQASYTRALNQKLKVADIFVTVQACQAKVPTVAMASYSLIFKKGPAEFVRAAKAAGIAGAVVPDLPVEEAEDLAKLCRDEGFDLILLVTPTTAPQRAERIVRACSGFVYVVSVVGITGERAAVSGTVRDVVGRLRSMTNLPLCVGFGVSTAEHVRDLRELVDGVIVGSALVKCLEGIQTPDHRRDAIRRVSHLVGELSRALNPS
jgi:tryptophan synthase alpha chain